MNRKQLEKLFVRYGFEVKKYENDDKNIYMLVNKDYNKNFSIDFNGNISLVAILPKGLFEKLVIYNYPIFFEISNIIPKQIRNHIYSNGSICYAPPERPIYEKWKLENFIIAVDSMINDWFNIQYLGQSTLKGLKHGEIGKYQYHYLKEQLYNNKI